MVRKRGPPSPKGTVKESEEIHLFPFFSNLSLVLTNEEERRDEWKEEGDKERKKGSKVIERR
jgi:hypothetical protein